MILCGKETENVLGKKLGDTSIFPITIIIERARSYKLTVHAADLKKQQFKFLVDGKQLEDYEYLHCSRDLQIPLPQEIITASITINGTSILDYVCMSWSIVEF